MLQCRFIIQLFDILKKEGIHTAIDTSGNFSITEEIKNLIELTDLFLLDIKCINNEICKDLSGVSNKKELEFAQYLSNIKKPMWIRQVLIPGITDKKEDLLQLRDFIHTLSSVEKVEFLPYHDIGRFKWEKLGVSYPLDNIRIATAEDVERAKLIFSLGHCD